MKIVGKLNSRKKAILERNKNIIIIFIDLTIFLLRQGLPFRNEPGEQGNKEDWLSLAFNSLSILLFLFMI